MGKAHWPRCATGAAALLRRHWDGMWWAWGAMAEFTRDAGMAGACRAAAGRPLRPLVTTPGSSARRRAPTMQAPTRRAPADGRTAVDQARSTSWCRYAEDERADATGEILAQAANFFPDILGRHVRLSQHASEDGAAGGDRRPGRDARSAAPQAHARKRPSRPSQVAPALKPRSMPMPGHSAYPWGHATQARVVAGLIAGSSLARRGGTAAGDEAWSRQAHRAQPRDRRRPTSPSDGRPASISPAVLVEVDVGLPEFRSPTPLVTVESSARDRSPKPPAEWK